MTMSQFAVLALCFLWGVRGLRTDNPPMQLGKTAVKTVGQLARTQVKGQGFKGFKGFKGTGFQFTPQTLNGFAHAPSYAFNGFRSQTGQLGRGFGTFGGQMGRMPMGTMQNTMARRFASTGAQVSKGVELLTFQNWPPGLKARSLDAFHCTFFNIFVVKSPSKNLVLVLIYFFPLKQFIVEVLSSL